MKSTTAAVPPSFLRLFRHDIPAGRELTLTRQRIYVLPTRHGLLFAVMLMAMLLGAVNYNNSLAFLLTFLLVALGLVSILFTYANLAGLRVRGGQTAPVFAGREARFIIELHPPNRRARCAVRAAAGTAAASVDIPADGSGTLSLCLPARHRGRLPLGRITLSTTYPLGLVRAWSYVDLGMHCLVYPRPGPHRATAAVGQARGEGRSAALAENDDFFGFRDYRRGDSLRHVHWKALARALPLMTRQFQGGESSELWLDWDALPPLDVENRLRQLCRLVLEAARGERAYGLRLPGTLIPPGQGPRQRQRCLEALALFETPR
jgi:uncharacterized protein (DUF58 family)